MSARKLSLFILFVFFASGVVLAQGNNQGPYPPPAGEFLRSIPNLDGAEEIWYYDSSKYQEEITGYYEALFRREGFNVEINRSKEVYDNTPATEITAQKKGLMVFIKLSVDHYNTGMVSVNVRKIYRPTANLPPLKLILPKKDVPGEDLKVVPRPPESVRIDSSREGCEEGKPCSPSTAYVSRLSPGQLRDFYLNRLSFWKIDRIIASGLSHFILASSDYGKLSIIITPNDAFGDRPSGSQLNMILMGKKNE